MNSLILNKNEGYDEISSFSDEDEVKSSKVVYCEKSPLIENNLSYNAVVSQQTTIVNEEFETEPQRWSQYLASLIATIGGFIMGSALGWSSPAEPMLKNHTNTFLVTNDDCTWISGLIAVGAFFGCPITASVVDKLGRKNMMIVLTVPTIIGWATIIYANSVSWIYIGRILTGFASGSYSVVVPLYTSEIADKEIRGTLGTYFQFQVALGILFSYTMGTLLNVTGLSIACSIIPLVYLCLIYFIPESPTFYLIKGNIEKAKMSLTFFRGGNCNVNQELVTIQTSLEKAEREKIPISKAFQTTPAKRGLTIGLGIMAFQQFSGCNAIIFSAKEIFDDSGYQEYSDQSSIILGVMSVLATYGSSLIIDKLGRKTLLLYSIVVMAICTFLIGGFFCAKYYNYDTSFIKFIPLFSLCLFIIMFSIGFGPIPWMMMAEIFPAQIKSIACSIICMANWLFVFLLIYFFDLLKSVIYLYNTFWLFTLFSVLGTFFVIFIVPETKNKTIEEIQELLGAANDYTPPSSTYENQNETKE